MYISNSSFKALGQRSRGDTNQQNSTRLIDYISGEYAGHGRSCMCFADMKFGYSLQYVGRQYRVER